MSKVTRPMVLDDTGKEMVAAIREVAEAFRVDLGGGASLPGVTNEDEGKVLTVVDGVWAAKVPEVQDSAGFCAEDYGLKVLKLSGDTAGMNQDQTAALNYEYDGRTGTLSCKWQGSSSLWFPKKNYSIAFDQAFEAAQGWGAHKQYVLKANWSDASGLRNLFGAKVWGMMVKTRANADERLKQLPNGGAVDGFPVWVTLNGDSLGLYMFTIPKKDWLFGMSGANAAEGFVCAQNAPMNAPVLCDGTDFKVEYAAGDTALLQQSLNNLIDAISSAKSTGDLTALEALVDVESVVDYYVFMAAVNHIDGINRNYILATYDGIKWFMSAYDMDATFGNAADGSGYGWANDWPMFTGETGLNLLLDVIRQHCAERIKARFQTLRYWELGEVSLQAELNKLAIKIPQRALQEDYRLWPSRPGTLTNTIHQIQEYTRLRMAALDYNVTTV